MDRQLLEDSESRFVKYVEGLTSVIGHADRAAPLHHYCAGLVAAEGRKSVEPIAAVTAPAEVSVQHQKLLHFVAESPWSDSRMLSKVREMVLPAMERRGPIEAWIIDDTSFPKQGRHSVGVHHQYCGELGKEANCQVAVTLSIANHHASLPIAYRLYLPEKWAEDAVRRKKAHIPEDIEFMTKPQIALEQIRVACAAGIRRRYNR
jgi:SRSO17 transposase